MKVELPALCIGRACLLLAVTIILLVMALRPGGVLEDALKIFH